MPATLAPEWLAVEKELGTRPRLEGTPEELRAQFAGLFEILGPSMPPPDPDVIREDKTVDGVPVRIYTPKSHQGQKLPVGVYTHGGGYVVGNLDSESLICDVLSKNTPAVIVNVDYRLSPEVKHPTALEDSLKAYKWAWNNADSIGGDQSKFFTVGSSAGGGLALGVANKVVENEASRSHIKGVVAIVPTTTHPSNCPAEYQAEFKSYTENDDAPVINHVSMDNFYTAAGAAPDDADNFVILSKNHSLFPPTYICVCGADPLRDDGIIMEKALSKAGVKTKIDKYPDLPHYFHIFPQLGAKAQEFLGNIIGGIHFVLSS